MDPPPCMQKCRLLIVRTPVGNSELSPVLGTIIILQYYNSIIQLLCIFITAPKTFLHRIGEIIQFHDIVK